MKKTFKLTHPKIKPARLVESIKHEIKKYLGRERRKTLPEGADYWTFDCQFGASADTAEDIYTSEINKRIDGAFEQELTEFYIVILARAEMHKPKIDNDQDSSTAED